MQLNNSGARKKKNFLLIIFLMLVLLFVCGCSVGRITEENYNKIHDGMSFNEVVEILGDDYDISSNAGYGEYSSSCYVWEGLGGANITIIFLNGKVFSKAQAGL